jgi:hypothetical protein
VSLVGTQWVLLSFFGAMHLAGPWVLRRAAFRHCLLLAPLYCWPGCSAHREVPKTQEWSDRENQSYLHWFLFQDLASAHVIFEEKTRVRE